MGGVDFFDRQNSDYEISFKTRKWTTRVIETILNYLLINARTAFGVANPITVPNLKKYRMNFFFRALIKSKYKQFDTPDKLQIVLRAKAPRNGRKRCFQVGCNKKQAQFCYNEKCAKPVCAEHYSFICLKCCNSSDFYNRATPVKGLVKIDKRARCRVKHCNSNSKLLCSNYACRLSTCISHAAYLCFPCTFNLQPTR